MLTSSLSKTVFELYSLRWERNFLYIFILVSGFFMIFPQIDLTVSRYFFQSGDFILSKHPQWIVLRDLHRVSQWYLLACMIVLGAIYALWYRPLPFIAPHRIVYIALTFCFGPGLLVHGLKTLIGRARPRELVEFGGLMDFTPAWQMAAMCRHSCSFPSGEAAAAAAMLSLLVFVPKRFRGWVAGIFIPLLVLISFNRVFMGAHFLSDIVIAWVLIIGLMLWFWPRVFRNADMIDNWVRLKAKPVRKRLYYVD
ncbi:phosphatase PAP2 family protein [Brucella gallinifaecis]|uniref:Phosphatase PAP2 family protein n=1 Tax=Brucella gallinifaecis TaxID=215590 RepID=A0A502BUB1_9HYPH|nr:phosphatase PAP2 family protein [Brucella gallinifaecis]TPF76766.1 phosphatase PAP2 family protein [Brucella gallinifaecis]